MNVSRLAVELVVFDLTGTTVRDDGAIISAFRDALEQHGIPFLDADLARMRGASKMAVFQALAERGMGDLRDEDAVRRAAELAYRTFKERLGEAYTHGPLEEIPGAEATLRYLRERGVKVAATTGLERELRDRVLERLGWQEGIFDAAVSPDEVPQGRPAPYMIFQAMMRVGVADVRRIAVVGDTPLDLQAGTNSGAAWVVGVLTGAHGLETLGSTRHTHILNSVADMPRMLENMQG